MTDHDRIEEMMAAQALGGLSAADEAELELLRAEHGRDCRECRRLESAYGDVAGRLAFALDPEPVPARMAEDILQRAEREGPLTTPGAVRPGWGRRVAVVAAAALLLVAGGVGGYVIGHPGGQGAAFRAVGDFLSQPSTRVVPLSSSGPSNLSVAYQPGKASAYLVGVGIPPAPARHVYELWRFARNGPPVPSGTFRASGPLTVLHIAADLSKEKEVAVTVERAPGTKRPTTTPVYSASIRV